VLHGTDRSLTVAVLIQRTIRTLRCDPKMRAAAPILRLWLHAQSISSKLKEEL